MHSALLWQVVAPPEAQVVLESERPDERKMVYCGELFLCDVILI